MSLLFNGTSSFGRWLGNLATGGEPYAIFAWVKPTSATTDGMVAGFADQVGSTFDECAIYLHGGTSRMRAFYKLSGANPQASSTSAVTTTWQPVLAVFDKNSRTIYHASGAKVTDSSATSGITPSNVDNFSIGVWPETGNSLFYGGELAEVWIWRGTGTVPDDTDWTSLAAGALPETIKTSGIVDGWSLLTQASSVVGYGGRTLTLTATTQGGAHPITRSAAATAVTMTGPTSGSVGVASSNFTIAANGSLSGSVTVTPSDGGGGGSFTPSSVTISAGTPSATFTYTPGSAGTKTISVTNNGSLTNPSNITFTASVAAATAVTMTGPTGGAVSSPSTNFTIGANGAITGTVVVTPTDNGGGGSFTPSTVSISSGSPTATFTYTPASTGAKTISVANNGGLTNPSNITYTATSAAATAVTMTGPTGGSVASASTNFTVGANGVISGTVVVTPNDSSGGGTFTPTSVSISSGSPTATFTYTPGTAGAKTIAVTNNGGLSNPSTITYTATAIGTITGDPITDEVGNSQAGVVIPKVVFMRVSDMTVQLSLTNQTVNGAKLLPVSNAALIPGVTYLRILCNADGTKSGSKGYTAT